MLHPSRFDTYYQKTQTVTMLSQWQSNVYYSRQQASCSSGVGEQHNVILFTRYQLVVMEGSTGVGGSNALHSNAEGGIEVDGPTDILLETRAHTHNYCVGISPQVREPVLQHEPSRRTWSQSWTTQVKHCRSAPRLRLRYMRTVHSYQRWTRENLSLL